MNESLRHLSTLVIGDDPVASGMLALDLVQAGIAATAASDDHAVLDAARDARDGGRLVDFAVVAVFDDVGRSVALWKALMDEALIPRYVVGVRPRDRALAEHDAIRQGWSGVAERPIQVSGLVELLQRPAMTPRQGGGDGDDVGDLGQRPLGELLDALVLEAGRGGRADAVVRLESDGRSGEVAMIEGQLVHAVADQDHGRHALERMCCWRRGAWRLVYGRHLGPRSLAGNWRGTLAAAHEYARRVDEARLTMPMRDAVCQVRWERARPLPPVAEAVFRRIAAGMPIGVAIDGEGDDELEALAALHSRIARGAVVAREGDRSPSSAAWSTSGTTGAFAARRASDQPATVSGALQPFGASPPGHVRHAATLAAAAPASGLAAHRTAPIVEGRRGATMAVGRDTLTGAATAAAAVVADPVAQARAGHRHAATMNYQSGAHTAPTPAGGRSPRPGEGTVAFGGSDDGRLLPDALPEALPGDDEAPAGDPQQLRQATGAWRGTNWFGVNVRADASAGQARLEALGRALVVPSPADRPLEADSYAPATTSMATRELMQAREPLDGAEALDAWTGGFDPAVVGDTEAADDRPRNRLWTSAALVVLGVALAVLVLWPESPLYRLMGREVDAPVYRTHRHAVTLIDEGRPLEALVMLQALNSRPDAPAEALLEQAILELELGDVERGRRDLHRYTLVQGARHAEAATRLHAAVGGELPTQ